MKHPRRLEAVQRWVKLAAGNPDPETLAWVAGVAQNLIAANTLSDPNERRTEIVKAVGLTGHSNEEQFAIRMLAESVDARVHGDGADSKAERRTLLRQLVRTVLMDREISDEAVDARILRATR